MQVARYWRMKQQNYRLQGIRYTNGVVSIQTRPVQPEPKKAETHQPQKIAS